MLGDLIASLAWPWWRAARSRWGQAVVLAVVAAAVVVPVVVPTPCEPVCDAVDRHRFFGPEGRFVAVSHEGLKDDPDDAITVDGFVRAYDLGYRYFETDLRLTTSGELVAVHTLDDHVDGRLPAGAGPSAAQLLHDQRLVGGRWNFEFSNPGPQHAEAVLALIDDPGVQDRVCVSFGRTLDQQVVDAFRDRMPDDLCTCASVAVRGRVGDVPLLRLLSGARSGWNAVDRRPVSCMVVADVFAGRNDVVEAGEGVVVLTWPALQPEEASRFREVVDAGFDGIMTDEPRLLRSVLSDVGRWTPLDPNPRR